MTSENIYYQLYLWQEKYDEKAKKELLKSMTLQEKEKFFALIALQKYEMFLSSPKYTAIS